jgi:hypothetical protein
MASASGKVSTAYFFCLWLQKDWCVPEMAGHIVLHVIPVSGEYSFRQFINNQRLNINMIVTAGLPTMRVTDILRNSAPLLDLPLRSSNTRMTTRSLK